jgi:tagatose 6-phosphate kinase
MILCIGATPAIQRVMVFPKFTLDAVNRASQTMEGAAGKSINVAKVLKALGERSVAIGFLGGDRGQALRRIIGASKIKSEFVEVKPPTRQCLTIIDSSAGTQTELVEESSPVNKSDYSQLLAVVRRRLAKEHCRAVVMSGTITPGSPTDFYHRCTRLAHAAAAFSVIDARGPLLLRTLAAKPGLVKPNRLELAATSGRELKSDADVQKAMCSLHERGAQRIVVTAGKNPSLAYDGHSFWKITSPRVIAVNPIGSGDSFTAGLVWRILRGDDLGEACRWGAAAGAANALTLMAGEVNRKDVKRLARSANVQKL